MQASASPLRDLVMTLYFNLGGITHLSHIQACMYTHTEAENSMLISPFWIGEAQSPLHFEGALLVIISVTRAGKLFLYRGTAVTG